MSGKNYHLRDLPSVRFQEHVIPQEFRQFVEERILPKIQLGGYKRQQKQATVTHACHNLVIAGLAAKCVADTRNTCNAATRSRVEIWDALVEVGFARKCTGSEQAGKTTRYYVTEKFLEMRRVWELRFVMDLHLGRNTEDGPPLELALVCLRSGRVDPMTGELLPEDERKQPLSFREAIAQHAQRGPDGKPDPKAIENGLRFHRGIEDVIDRINRANLSHSWIVDAVCPQSNRRYAFQPNPMLRMVHVGAFFRAARLYGFSAWSVQNLPKHVRQTMLIDGEAVAELDFSGMAPRMLYHRAGIDPEGDVYRPELVLPRFYDSANASRERREVVREFIKRATNICFNVPSRAKANAAVGRLFADGMEDGVLHQAIYQVEKTTPAGVIDRIVSVHPALRSQFFTEVGAQLMTIDGGIMLGILDELTKAGRAAAGIHDSVVCRVSDAAFVEQTMVDVYQLHLGFSPLVKRAF